MEEVYNSNIWNSSKRQVEEYLNNFGEVKNLEHKFLKVDEKTTHLVLNYEQNGNNLESTLRLPYNVERDEDYKVILYIHDKCELPFKTVNKG